jgi:hypothetical protein
MVWLSSRILILLVRKRDAAGDTRGDIRLGMDPEESDWCICGILSDTEDV